MFLGFQRNRFVGYENPTCEGSSLCAVCIEWNKAAFDSLVLQNTTKNLVEALMSNQTRAD